MSAPQVNKPQSKVSLSNIKKRVSQVTEQLSGDSSQRNSCELIELNEQACSASVASSEFDLFLVISLLGWFPL